MKTTKLKKLDACGEAIRFSAKFKTPKEAWENCPRGDWMLWIAARLKVDTRLLTLAKGRCAETVIHLMKDQRSINAVKAAIAYGKGEINNEELRAAANAAYAAYAAAAAAAYAAADAAAAAADATYAAADAAYVAKSANLDLVKIVEKAMAVK